MHGSHAKIPSISLKQAKSKETKVKLSKGKHVNYWKGKANFHGSKNLHEFCIRVLFTLVLNNIGFLTMKTAAICSL